MKSHTMKLMLFLAALSLTTASCQKGELFDSPITSQEAVYSHTVVYAVDGVQQTATFYTEEEWQAFLNHLFALAKEGYQVSFRSLSSASSTVASKEKVVYTTENQTDAQKWADKMEDLGYFVTITYDEGTGMYTCIAIK